MVRVFNKLFSLKLQQSLEKDSLMQCKNDMQALDIQ